MLRSTKNVNSDSTYISRKESLMYKAIEILVIWLSLVTIIIDCILVDMLLQVFSLSKADGSFQS